MTDEIERVHYFPEQFLRAQDFADEQAYHLADHRRHNIAHHIWGIVVGLELVADKEGNLFVEAGVAADGFGRELVLGERQPLSSQPFADKGTNVLDVFLNYNRTGSDEAPKGYAGCGDNGDTRFYRWREQPFLTFEEPGAPPLDRRQPPGVLDTDQDFAAFHTPFDEPEHRWPVFLGQVTLDRTNQAQPFTVDLAGRPYVGLIGESVCAPSGRARIQIGTERQGDPYRFAVFVPAAETLKTQRKPRFAIRQGKTVEIRGDTTLHGNLTVDGRAVEFRPGPERSRTGGPPRIYHVENQTEHELRVEMVDPDTAAQQVVIGSWSAEQGKFQPCLTITNDCVVTVHGNLVVEGVLDESKATRVDAGVGEEAQRVTLASFAAGVTGATALLSTTAQGDVVAGPVLTLQAAAEIIAASPEASDTFAQFLKDGDPATAEALRDKLAPEPPAEGKEPSP